ncbi:MAG: CinA family protein [Neisseria sp.]|uniref:CinA family protein n=1 Tax=Neisseria sp. TaxID=192066 RepID=UPI0026DCA893|nr:CinA family protein [Neisseria sp.]MDO4640626.1 CinA family protein [Neisseria sp.]
MEDILHRVTARLAANHQTVTCAESCTGGLLAAELTRLSGSSAWFETGFITYSNEAKHRFLGVNQDTLNQYGAVSAETVKEMAVGARQAAKSDYALSISGIAGPTGGSVEKPVGTVWFGLAYEGKVFAVHRQFDGNRDSIRSQAVRFALSWLDEVLSERR